MFSGVYKITNKLAGRAYIGSAVSIVARLRKHKRMLKVGSHTNIKLQRAWNKYGPDAFVFEALLYCSKENLLDYEQRCIDGFDSVNSGYNICPTAGSRLGTKHSPESLEKIAASSKGRRHSEESKKRMSEILLGHTRCLGVKFSDDARANMSEARKGNKNSLGVKASEETRAKLSAAAKGRTHTPDVRARISEAMKGNKRSLGRKRSPETIARMRESQQRRRAAEVRI